VDVGRIGANNIAARTNEGSAVKKDTSAKIDTTDKLQKGKGTSFFKRVKNFVRTNITGADRTEEAAGKESWGRGDYGSVKNGALIGTAIGGSSGAVIGYVTTETDPANLPQQTVELEWQEPVLRQKYLGEIPRNNYEPVKSPGMPVGKEISRAFRMMGQEIQNEIDPTR